MDFSEFDKKVDFEELGKSIAEARKNNDFPEVPNGTYITKLVKLELGKTKADNRPMVKADFKILEGEFKNSHLFYNKVIYGTKNDGNMIASVLGFLNNLEPTEEVGPIEFKSYSQFSELLLDIAEDCAEALNYEVVYEKDAFNSISIKSAIEL